MLQAIRQAFAREPGFEDLAPHENATLIHFTTRDAALAIQAQGFRYGSPLTANLGHTSGKYHVEPGLNFAFFPEDDYSIMAMAGYDFGEDVEAVVIFQADAVRMQHMEDVFYQAAFWGPHARGPFQVLIACSEDEDLEPHERRWFIEGREEKTIRLFEALDVVLSAATA